MHRNTTAAIRRSDNRRILIKVLVSPFRRDPAINELEIHKWLLADGRDKDPANHTIPILETLRFTVECLSNTVPGVTDDIQVFHPLTTESVFHVLPWLEPPITTGPYIRYQRIVFIKQMLEGLAFMHRNLVAHGDIDISNVMVGVVRNGQVETDFPFKPTTFLAEDVRFYYIDIDFSHRFANEDEARRKVLVKGGRNADLAPELCIPGLDPGDIPCDLFKLDVWVLGLEMSVIYGGMIHEWAPMSILYSCIICDSLEARLTAHEACGLFDALIDDYFTLPQALRPYHWPSIEKYKWSHEFHKRDGPVKSRWTALRYVLGRGQSTVALQSLLVLRRPLVKRDLKRTREAQLQLHHEKM